MTKRIIICGDSWSVIPMNMYTYLTDHDTIEQRNNWLDWQLRIRKHDVCNIGRCAHDNQDQLEILMQMLSGFFYNNLPVDLILWFQTEHIRDITNRHLYKEKNSIEEMTNLDLDLFVDKLAEKSYSTATELKKKYPHTQWAIIGGHAPIRQSKKHMLDWADLLIDNWRNDITGVDCPDCQLYTLIRYEGIENYIGIFSKEMIDREMSYAEIITNACRDSKLFYDGVHPSAIPNQYLTNLIIEKFNL